MAPMRPIPVAVLAVAVCCALLSAACGTAATSAAPGAASSPAAVGSAALASPTGRPTQTSSSPSGPVGSGRPSPTPKLVIPHDDVELEKLLPATVDGKTLMKLSVGPVSSIGVPGAQGIKDAAKQIGDGSGNFGLAYGGDPDGMFNTFALRIPGAEPSALLTSFAQMTIAETLGGKADTATLGGRSVVHIADPTSQIGDVWFYAIGDTLYGAQAGSEAEATKLLALLPQK
jgi:hypothetical protein